MVLAHFEKHSGLFSVFPDRILRDKTFYVFRIVPYLIVRMKVIYSCNKLYGP